MTPLYLDHNATTPLLPEVVDAMLPFLTTHFGNPSSGHAYGRVAKAAIEQARAQVAALVGASADEVVFTGGGTEATALALRGTLRAHATDRPHPPGLSEPVLDRPTTHPAQLITTRVEHPATARVIDALEREGVSVRRLPVDQHGLLDLRALEAAVGEGTRLVTVIHAHNETGVLQPLPALSAVTRRHGALLHADASQSAGKVPLSLAADGFDLLTLAAHKLYGPKGVGALVVRRGVTLASVALGAGQEHGRRAGTENVASIVGFGAACAAAARDLASEAARLLALRERLISALAREIPGLVVAGAGAPRLPNTVYALFPGVVGARLLERASGVAASTGSACHDGQDHPPQVLLEQGFAPAQALGAVRLTMGRHTREADVDAAAGELIAAWRGLAATRQ